MSMTGNSAKIFVISEFSRLGRRAMKSFTTNQQPTRPAHLTTKQIAEWLGYHERTITAWALAWHQSGQTEGIPAHRYGRRKWSFVETEVRAWIEAGGLNQELVRKTGT
jgi:Helix-turn-helix domain